MILYLDTSSLVKLYVEEEDSDAVRLLFRELVVESAGEESLESVRGMLDEHAASQDDASASGGKLDRPLRGPTGGKEGHRLGPAEAELFVAQRRAGSAGILPARGRQSPVFLS